VLKKTITFKDFNDQEVSEDHFFHLTKAELVELEMSVDGGLSESLQKIIASEDGKQIIAQFKEIILGSYGKKSDDGRRFIKNQQLRDEFESSEAYSTLFMELVTDAGAAAEFVNGIVPTNLAQEALKITSGDITAVPDPPTPEVISRQDIQAMSGEELATLGARISSGEAVVGD
jgi:hypothetical protein